MIGDILIIDDNPDNLRVLEGILAALRVGYSAEETNDMFTGLLTLRLGRYREQFAAHFAQSLNTDRSVRAAYRRSLRSPGSQNVQSRTGAVVGDTTPATPGCRRSVP